MSRSVEVLLLLLEKEKKSLASFNDVLNNLVQHRGMNVEARSLDIPLLCLASRQRVRSHVGIADDVLVLLAAVDLD